MAEEQKSEQAAGAAAEEQDESLLDSIISDGKMARVPDQRQVAKELLGEFTRQILDENMVVDKSLISSLEIQIKQIDELLNKQVNEIIHNKDFQELEASWRGLAYLVFNTETSTLMKIRLLNATKKDVAKDLSSAIEFDQSRLFKIIYEEEFGTFGGTPYGMLVGNYNFDKSAKDIGLLRNLSNVAAAAHAPFIAAASSELLNIDSFEDLPNPRDLKKIFESSDFISWNSFRATEDSRYIALTLPRVLMRLPYDPENNPVEEFEFTEQIMAETEHKKFLWGNAAWALAERITNCYTKYGWISAFRGVEGGGLVQNLPTHVFKTDDGDLTVKCPSEIAITDRREKELSDLGFIALCYQKNSDQSAFFGGSTVNKPKKYNQDDATANAFLSAQLQYIFSASRFAHYLKVIARDKIGSFTTVGEFQAFLTNWISDYIIVGNASFEEKVRHPLSAAAIKVEEIPGKPGSFKAVAHVKPHLQLEELTTSIRLVANLPGG